MTPISFLYRPPCESNEAKFLYANFTFIFMNKKRTFLYTLYGTHRKIHMHIKFHRGLGYDITHSHIASVG
jgi:hypothetical protein